MNRWTLAWDDVGPLFQDAWQGGEAAVAVLGRDQLFELLFRLATHAYNTRRDCRQQLT